MKSITLAWTPFSGLGLYNGFRGNRWLRNRIKIYKQFVVPSLLNQTDKDFVLWISWRPEEKSNKYVKELEAWLRANTPLKVLFTYGGLCMWDDKYDEVKAREKLFLALRRTAPEMIEVTSEMDEVYVWLVPSDDLYDKMTHESIKNAFKQVREMQAVGFTKGWLCNYATREILEYNPTTNPPFFAYRIPRNLFIDPGKHMTYISTKRDEGKYKKGTPYPSHEWIPNAFSNMGFFDQRGFMVGTHSENISTHFNHPFGGLKIEADQRLELLDHFGIRYSPNLKLPFSFRKAVMRRLPYYWQRKLRYLLGEKFFNRFYQFIRN